MFSHWKKEEGRKKKEGTPTGQVRTSKVRTGKVRTGQIRTGQVKTVRSGQVRTITFLDPKCT